MLHKSSGYGEEFGEINLFSYTLPLENTSEHRWYRNMNSCSNWCSLEEKKSALVILKLYIELPLSSINTMLLLSNFGMSARCFCFTPTITAFFFCPLMATKILSPIKKSTLVPETTLRYYARAYLLSRCEFCYKHECTLAVDLQAWPPCRSDCYPRHEVLIIAEFGSEVDFDEILLKMDL